MAYTNIEDQKQNKREYYQANKEVIKARSRRWNIDNHDQYLERLKQRKTKHKAQKDLYKDFITDSMEEYYLATKNLKFRPSYMEWIKEQEGGDNNGR